MRILVTGGAGFIGSAVCRYLIGSTTCSVLNLDKLTYAANLSSLKSIEGSPNYTFVRGDIGDRSLIRSLLKDYQPHAIMNLAAETHVDRSIDASDEFVQTNVEGTYRLLEEARRYFNTLPSSARTDFRFHHVSADEVYGDLGHGEPCPEATAYNPSSPYAASKAASDFFVRAWARTYGIPILITNCSNNYGPHQFPEKLIPLIILRALTGEELPVYGRGDNVRDWLHVEDHARALALIVQQGAPNATYNVGGGAERDNLKVVEQLCNLLDELVGPLSIGPRTALIRFVEDRPGHDKRYAINADKLRSELGWRPLYDFDTGLRATVHWYLDNEAWWAPLLDRSAPLARLGRQQELA